MWSPVDLHLELLFLLQGESSSSFFFLSLHLFVFSHEDLLLSSVWLSVSPSVTLFPLTFSPFSPSFSSLLSLHIPFFPSAPPNLPLFPSCRPPVSSHPAPSIIFPASISSPPPFCFTSSEPPLPVAEFLPFTELRVS